METNQHQWYFLILNTIWPENVICYWTSSYFSKCHLGIAHIQNITYCTKNIGHITVWVSCTLVVRYSNHNQEMLNGSLTRPNTLFLDWLIAISFLIFLDMCCCLFGCRHRWKSCRDSTYVINEFTGGPHTDGGLHDSQSAFSSGM